MSVSHGIIFRKFCEMGLGGAVNEVKAWYPLKENSIRVVMNPDGEEYIFTYRSNTDWRIETPTSYAWGDKLESEMNSFIECHYPIVNKF